MCLVGAAIANNGVINQPYLVDSVKNASGEVSWSANKQQLASPVSPDISKRVAKVLEGVVRRGTGASAAIPGVTVAGKTGTAEKGADRIDS